MANQELEALSKDALIEALVSLRESHTLLKKEHATIREKVRQALLQEKDKARKEKESLEKAALDIAQAVGELSQEKKAMESSALDIAQAVGELSQEKLKMEEERRAIESSALDIAQAVGELSEQKTKAELEKKLIEQSALDIIKNLTEISEHHSEELTDKFLSIQNMSATPVPASETMADYKAGFLKAVDQIRLLKAEYSRLLQNIYPASLIPSLEAKKELFPMSEVTVLVVVVSDYYSQLLAMNPMRFAKLFKQVQSEIQAIVLPYNGWLIHTSQPALHVVFGSPDDEHAHALEAAQAAREIMNYAANSEFKLSIRIHTGPAILGDFGASGRPYFGVSGILFAYIELMKKAEQATPGSVIITETIFSKIKNFFRAEKLERVDLKKQGPMQLYRLDRPLDVTTNPNRLEPGGFLATKYAGLVHEIRDKRAALFKGWAFEKIEVRDGSLGTGEAIAFYALTFARESRVRVNEDLLIKTAFLINVGKASIPKKILNNSASPENERRIVKNLHQYSIALIAKFPQLKECGSLIAMFRNEIDDIKSPEAQFLKIANTFEGIAFSKFYKKTSANFKQAVNIFRNAFPHPLYKQFAELISK